MASKKNSKWRACRDAKVSTKSVGRDTNISLVSFYAARIIFLTIAFCAPMFPGNPFGVILPQCWSISLFTKDTCDWRVLVQDHSWDCHCGQLFCNLRPRGGRVVTPVPQADHFWSERWASWLFLCLQGSDQKFSHNLYETSKRCIICMSHGNWISQSLRMTYDATPMNLLLYQQIPTGFLIAPPLQTWDELFLDWISCITLLH